MTMTDTTEPGQPSIGEQTARLEEIITQLEDGEVSLERAKELHGEGKGIVQQLEDDLEVWEGEVPVEKIAPPRLLCDCFEGLW